LPYFLKEERKVKMITARINPYTGNIEILKNGVVVRVDYESPAVYFDKYEKTLYIAFPSYYEGLIPDDMIGKLLIVRKID
jgi:hypothetical protein